MGLDTHERQKSDYFIGTEVENTAMKGEKTLFVVGVKETHDIIKRALNHVIRSLKVLDLPSPYGMKQALPLKNGPKNVKNEKNVMKKIFKLIFW